MVLAAVLTWVATSMVAGLVLGVIGARLKRLGAGASGAEASEPLVRMHSAA